MKIWFGCTTHEWEKYREKYLAIREELIKQGNVLLFDWIPGTDGYIERHGHIQKDRDIKKIFNQVIEAVNKCDITIIEYTIPSFSSSHQINLSLACRKPTLVLREKDINPEWSNSYIDAVESPLLFLKEYQTQEECIQIVKEFLGKFKNGYGQERYNFVLDKRQNYYLDWASDKYSKSRSEILRELIEREMDSDTSYKELIKG